MIEIIPYIIVILFAGYIFYGLFLLSSSFFIKLKEDFATAFKSKVLALKTSIHAMTTEAVKSRWPFESAIKRSYFHIKPLDETQKQNWKKYLNFEESEGDVVKIYALYERCMVPCVGLLQFDTRRCV